MVCSPISTLLIVCPLSAFAFTRATGRTRLIASRIARDTLSSITALSAGTIRRATSSGISCSAPSSAIPVLVSGSCGDKVGEVGGVGGRWS